MIARNAPSPGNVAFAQMDAEEALAQLRGWTNVRRIGGTILGTPPDGAPNSRGEAVVPKWARDWTACGPLIFEYSLLVSAGARRQAPDTEWALMLGIVAACIDAETIRAAGAK